MKKFSRLLIVILVMFFTLGLMSQITAQATTIAPAPMIQQASDAIDGGLGALVATFDDKYTDKVATASLTSGQPIVTAGISPTANYYFDDTGQLKAGTVTQRAGITAGPRVDMAMAGGSFVGENNYIIASKDLAKTGGPAYAAPIVSGNHQNIKKAIYKKDLGSATVLLC